MSPSLLLVRIQKCFPTNQKDPTALKTGSKHTSSTDKQMGAVWIKVHIAPIYLLGTTACVSIFFFLHCTCARKSSNSTLHTSCPWLHATLVYLYHHHLSSGLGCLLVSPYQTLVSACCFILLLVSHLCFASTAAPGQPLAPLLRAFKHKGFPWGQPSRGKESAGWGSPGDLPPNPSCRNA